MIGFILSIIPAALSTFLKWKAGESTTYIAELTADVERRRIAKEQNTADLGHWIAWMPRFTIGMSVALFVAAVMVVSTFPSGWFVGILEPRELPEDFKVIVSVVIISYFGYETVKLFRR